MATTNATRKYQPKPCVECSASFTPRGGRQTYCNECTPPKHRKYPRACTRCGEVSMRYPGERYQPFCGTLCRDAYSRQNKIGVFGREKKTPQPKPKSSYDPRSPIRKAVESGNHAFVIAAIQADCTITDEGCWNWTRQSKSGYPYVTWSGRTYQVHRLSLEAKLEQSLGKQAAHHVCANPICVNPDHLQPVTAAQNTAEMLARTYMVGRIEELERELARLDPSNPLLDEVGVSLAA